MINRLFLSFAAILTNLVLAYAHLRVYVDTRKGDIETPPQGIVHVNSSEQVLTPILTLSFGIAFSALSVLAIYFSSRSMHKAVFITLVACLMLIWVRLWAGAV